jgi:hypothetical protein
MAREFARMLLIYADFPLRAFVKTLSAPLRFIIQIPKKCYKLFIPINDLL